MSETPLGSLPDISGFASVPRATWLALGKRLRAAGFCAGHLDPRGSEQDHPWAAVAQRPLRVWRCRQQDDAASLAARLFQLNDPIPHDRALALLGADVLNRLLDSGVLLPCPGVRVVSPFDLRLYRGLALWCDNLAHGGDAVFGVGPGTAAFVLPLRPHRPIDAVLDLGCGAGAVALWLASQVRHVVGTDINPRALAFAAVNAAINDVRNVEWRQGDLFAAVSGERFDWVGAQPPYVPLPDATTSGLRPATYLHGGRRGNEILMRLLRDLPGHLMPGGRAQVVFDQPMDASSAQTRRGWPFEWPFEGPSDAPMRSLVLLGAAIDADAYSLRQATPSATSGGMPAFSAQVVAWREHLQRLGIEAVSPAIAVLERAEPGAGWHDVVCAGNGLWNEVSSATLDRLYAGHDWLHRRGETPPLQPHIPQTSLVIRPFDSPDGPPGRVYLGLPGDHLFGSLQIDAAQWEILQRLHDGRPASSEQAPELLALAARTGLIHV